MPSTASSGMSENQSTWIVPGAESVKRNCARAQSALARTLKVNRRHLPSARSFALTSNTVSAPSYTPTVTGAR